MKLSWSIKNCFDCFTNMEIRHYSENCFKIFSKSHIFKQYCIILFRFGCSCIYFFYYYWFVLTVGFRPKILNLSSPNAKLYVWRYTKARVNIRVRASNFFSKEVTTGEGVMTHKISSLMLENPTKHDILVYNITHINIF